MKWILIMIIILFATIAVAQPNYTTRTCNVHGSASSTGVACPGVNEDGTDATADSCLDGNGFAYGTTNNIIINATSVPFGSSIKIICEACVADKHWEHAILYKNTTHWNFTRVTYFDEYFSGALPCPTASLRNHSSEFILNNVTGQHTLRCMHIGFSSCTSSYTCCSDTYSEQDDMNITVFPIDTIRNIQNNTPLATSIKVEWDNPYGIFHNKSLIYLNGTNIENITRSFEYYRVKGLGEGLSYNITVYVEDELGNINDSITSHNSIVANTKTYNDFHETFYSSRFDIAQTNILTMQYYSLWFNPSLQNNITLRYYLDQ